MLVLSWLISLNNVLKIHPNCRTYQNFTNFQGQIIVHCTQRPRFVYPFICGRTFGCFHLSALVYNDALHGASQAALVVKGPPANARDVRDTRSMPGQEKSLGGGHSNPLQYSCLENPMDKGEPGGLQSVGLQSRTRLKRLSTHARCSEHECIIICSSPCLQSFGIYTHKWNYWIIW